MSIPPADAPHIVPPGAALCAEQVLAYFLEAQRGTVARRQLLEAGVSRHVIARWLADRRLRRLYAGVYTVCVPPFPPSVRCMAAALAGGAGAGIGFFAATFEWSLAESLRETVDVYAPTHRRSRPGLRFHENLPPDELTVHEGVPVTIPPRALLDVSPFTPIHRLERMFYLAEERGLASTLSLPQLIERYPSRPGTPKLRAILARYGTDGIRRLRSDGEAALLAFCDRHGLRRPPHTNHLLDLGDVTYELDQ